MKNSSLRIQETGGRQSRFSVDDGGDRPTPPPSGSRQGRIPPTTDPHDDGPQLQTDNETAPMLHEDPVEDFRIKKEEKLRKSLRNARRTRLSPPEGMRQVPSPPRHSDAGDDQTSGPKEHDKPAYEDDFAQEMSVEPVVHHQIIDDDKTKVKARAARSPKAVPLSSALETKNPKALDLQRDTREPDTIPFGTHYSNRRPQQTGTIHRQDGDDEDDDDDDDDEVRPGAERVDPGLDSSIPPSRQYASFYSQQTTEPTQSSGAPQETFNGVTVEAHVVRDEDEESPQEHALVPIVVATRDNKRYYMIVGVVVIVIAVILVVVIVVVVVFLGLGGGDDGGGGETSPNPSPSMPPSLSNQPSGFVPPEWTQLGQILTGAADFDEFGSAVAISGDGTILAAGSENFDSDTLSRVGHVRVYVFDGTSRWSTQAELLGPEASSGFGNSLDLSSDGTVMAVSAPSVDFGTIFVYQLLSDNSQWVPLGDPVNGADFSRSIGGDVVVSGDGLSVAVGDVGFESNTGWVSVYAWDGTQWQSRGSQSGESQGEEFGSSLDISDDGKIFAAGAPLNNNNAGTRAGSASVFRYVEATNSWERIGQVLVGEAPSDQFGRSVSLSADGNTVAVASPLNDDIGDTAGHVRVFTFSDQTWGQIGQDIDGENARDQSGSAISLSADGNILAIGADGNDGPGTRLGAGHVRVFGYNGTGWSQIGGDIDGRLSGDRTGSAVAISDDGSQVAIGASSAGSNFVGEVSVYRLD